MLQPELRQIAAEAYTDAFRRMVEGEMVDIWQRVADAVVCAYDVHRKTFSPQLAEKSEKYVSQPRPW